MGWEAERNLDHVSWIICHLYVHHMIYSNNIEFWKLTFTVMFIIQSL